MPGLFPDPEHLVQCDDCSTHFQLSPGMASDGVACPECGGKRLFFGQPSPVESEGTLRDMVDSASQKDNGGNPLGEGSIVGSPGDGHATQPAWRRDEGTYSHTAGNRSSSMTERVVAHRTLNTEPYMPWTHEASTQHTAGPAAVLAIPAAEAEAAALPAEIAAGGAAADAVGGAAAGAADAVGGAASGAADAVGGAASDVANAGGGLINKGLDAAKGLINDLNPFSGGPAGVAKKMAPTLMKGVLRAGEDALGAGTPQAGAMGPEQVTQAPNMMQLGSADIPFLLVADLETPHSVESVDEQEDDPHDQDQKQFSDGDDSPSNHLNPNNEDSGADGEDGPRQKSEGYGFGENSPGLERMMMIMPLLMHYFESPESGDQDPIIKALHETLEQENPGYLKQEDPDGHGHIQLMIQQHKQPRGVHAGVGPFPSGIPQIATPANGIQPGGGGQCPTCGGVTEGDGHCPQCGSGGQKTAPDQAATPGNTMPPQGPPSVPPMPTLANHIGPVTPEQIEAVAQLLIAQGRSGEIEAMKQDPQLYAKELQEVQQNPQPAPPLVDPSQSQPPAPMEQAPGGMPMPGMGGAPGGQPMQAMAGASVTQVPLPCTHCHGRGCGACNFEGLQNVPPLSPPQIGSDGYSTPGRIGPGDATMQTPEAVAAQGLHNEPRWSSSDVFWGSLEKESDWGETQRSEGMYGQPGPMHHMEEEEEEPVDPACPMCSGPGDYMGSLGSRDHYRCRNCGMDFSHSQEQHATPADLPSSDSGIPPGYPHTADANNLVPRCPKCNTATTSLIAGADNDPNEALAKCHNPGCGHVWKLKEPTTSRQVWAEVPNPTMQTADQQHAPVDHQHTHDPTMAWKDAEGNALEAGQEYELHSPAFPVPDEIRVLDVKPDGILVDLVGLNDSFGPQDSAQGGGWPISRQEAQLEHYTFVRRQTDQDMDDRNTEPPTGTPGLEQVPPSGQTTDQVQDSYPNTALSHTHAAAPLFPPCPNCNQVRGFSPYPFARGYLSCNNKACQHLIKAEDLAHIFNTQSLDLMALPETHHPTDESENHISHVEDPNCMKCGSAMVDSIMSSPTMRMHSCVPCGHVWETKDEYEGREAGVDLSWLREDSGPGDFFGDMERARAMAEAGGNQSRSLSAIASKDDRLQAIKARLDAGKDEREHRLAGRHFTPGERRELIDEMGHARNLSGLDLSNTHYDTRVDYTGKAHGENAPDEHLVFGL